MLLIQHVNKSLTAQCSILMTCLSTYSLDTEECFWCIKNVTASVLQAICGCKTALVCVCVAPYYVEYNRASEFVNFYVQGLDLSWSPILIPLIQLFVTGSDELGWDHLADGSASPCPTIVQISLKLSLCLVVSEVDCFYALLNETFLPQLKGFYASKKCPCFIKKKLSYFLFFEVISYFCDSSLISSWNQTGVLYWKLILEFVMIESKLITYIKTALYSAIS
jgi:hypothetical protein